MSEADEAVVADVIDVVALAGFSSSVTRSTGSFTKLLAGWDVPCEPVRGADAVEPATEPPEATSSGFGCKRAAGLARTFATALSSRADALFRGLSELIRIQWKTSESRLARSAGVKVVLVAAADAGADCECDAGTASIPANAHQNAFHRAGQRG
jgi:hypothetical protein